MPAPHDYIYTFCPDSDEPGIGERPGVDLRKAPADKSAPPPEVPPPVTRPPATQAPAPKPTQPPSTHPPVTEDDTFDDIGLPGQRPSHGGGKWKRIAIVTLLGVFLLAGPAFFNDTKHLRVSEPMFDMTQAYTKKLHIYPKWPFVMSYYLMLPEGYNPQYSYPLVVGLHGVGEHTYPGYFLAQPQFRRAFPAIVVIPFISKRSMWHTPPDPNLVMQGAGGPFAYDTLENVVGLIFKLAEDYAIDPARVYIAGHSMGGMGAYAAAAHHDDVFAAAVTSAGAWATQEADMIDIPVLSYHGTADRQIPAPFDKHFIEAANKQGANISYVELPGRGHDIWREVYGNPQTWQWLFSQKKTH